MSSSRPPKGNSLAKLDRHVRTLNETCDLITNLYIIGGIRDSVKVIDTENGNAEQGSS